MHEFLINVMNKLFIHHNNALLSQIDAELRYYKENILVKPGKKLPNDLDYVSLKFVRQLVGKKYTPKK